MIPMRLRGILLEPCDNLSRMKKYWPATAILLAISLASAFVLAKTFALGAIPYGRSMKGITFESDPVVFTIYLILLFVTIAIPLAIIIGVAKTRKKSEEALDDRIDSYAEKQQDQNNGIE